jgi:hypothetical protein
VTARVAALALAGAALLPAPAAACSARAAPDARVPTFAELTGVTPGHTISTPEQIDRYLRAVDRATPRVRTFLAGRSGQGRPIRYAAVGEPRAVARLDALGALMRRVRAGAVPADRTAAIARTRPAFVWIGANVHGNEVSGGEADLVLLHELASSRTCADEQVLRHTVVFFLPLQNPDGRAVFERVNHRGFDLNRDWFARTQPETRAKVAALVRFPPTIYADQHEEGGTAFFFPPNADPVHHEISGQALHAIDGIVAPRLRRAFRARGLAFTNYATYDLFFMGYGDTVPTTLFGAAGMTFEKGAESPLADKVAQHLLAARQTLLAAAAHHRALLGGWAQEWRAAAAQGRRGTLQPNRVVEPHNTVRFPVPDEKVYGYVLEPGADAAALVQRLRSVGVRVRRIAAPDAAVAYRAYGGGTGAAGPGDYYVPMAQAAKHWVEALLGEDPDVPFPYFFDVSSWSNPLLMGLAGGSLGTPLTVRTDAITGADRPAGSGSTWAGGSETGVELAFALLAKGARVKRDTTTGAFQSDADLAAAARARRVPLGPAPAGGDTLVPLRRPRVALLADNGPSSASGWADWLLAERYGLKVAALSSTDVATGALAGSDVLVVPDGYAGADQLSAAALVALQAWVRGGGTLVGWRGRGIAVAQAAGVTSVTMPPSDASLQIPGVSMRVALDPADPVAFGERPDGFAFNTGDPLIAANGAPVVVRYPPAERFFVSGYATGYESLYGRPAATDEHVGSGRVVLFSFDPVFRGYVEATERLVGNALLAPAPAAGRRATPPRAVAPRALAAAPSPYRDATVEVPAEDEPALLAAARAAGVPVGFTLDRDLTTVTLRVPNRRGLDPEERPWTRRLPAALAAAGGHVLLAIF